MSRPPKDKKFSASRLKGLGQVLISTVIHELGSRIYDQETRKQIQKSISRAVNITMSEADTQDDKRTN
jgi:hypothetical protein